MAQKVPKVQINGDPAGAAKVPKFVTEEPTGDMLKSVYDTDNDGIVDNSEKLEGSTKIQVQDHVPKAHDKTYHTSPTLPDVDAHLVPDAHHPSGNIREFALGLKTGIKAGANITIVDDAGYASIASSGGVAAAKTTLAIDETEVSKTGVAEGVFVPLDKTFDFIKDSAYFNLQSIKVMLQIKVTATYTGTIKIYLDSEASPRWTFTTTSSSFELKSGTTDISALAVGLHTLTIKGYTNNVAATVYLRLYHVLGEE